MPPRARASRFGASVAPVLLGLGVSGLAACGTGGASTDDGPIATSSAAVIDGIASPTAQDFVVEIVRPAAANEAYVCSGALIAPNLVLTARHCVSATADVTFSCLSDGEGTAGGDIGPDFDPSSLSVFAGTVAPTDLAASNAVGVRILHDGGTTICDHDIALLVLDQPLTGVPIAALNLDTKPPSGELITSIGWGVIADGGSPAVRQQRTGVPILAVGPGTDPGGYVVGENEFEVGEDICEGDSGSPALDPMNAIIGVVSRGGNGTTGSMNPAATCLGDRTTNFYTGVAGFKQMILDAFTTAGATPTLVEVPMGQSCSASGECTSGLCATIGTAASEVCTQSCESGACPSGFRCDTTSGALPLCVAAPSSGSGGCVLAPEGASSREGFGWAALVVAVGLVTARRRSRSRPR